ncbi:MAG: hypothetical protein GC165_10680 [Armatimonadetes bacterium]|nr:hypothetical protein [Armatimonadota bacterium]
MSASIRTIVWPLVGAAVLGASFLAVKAQLVDRGNDRRPNFHAATPPEDRPRIKPSGSFEVTLARSDLPQLPLASMSDHGDFLFLANEKKGEYELYREGDHKTVKAPDPTVVEHLLPNGSLTQSVRVATNSGISPNIFPFNESDGRSKFLSTGQGVIVQKNIAPNSIASPVEGKEVDPKHQAFTKDYYTLLVQTRKVTNIDPPPRAGGAMLAVPMPANGVRPAPAPQAGTGVAVNVGNYYNKILSSEEQFASEDLIGILCVDDRDRIWLVDHQGSIALGKDRFYRLEKGEKEEFPFPDQYEAINRVAATGDQIAATFGILHGRLPFRSFSWTGSSWQELPMPDGFDCSFVQTIFSDGTILGYLSTWDGQKVEHVLWRGDKLAVLDDQPGWPKHGQLALVDRASRRGDLAIRNITDLISGGSDYYVIAVH